MHRLNISNEGINLIEYHYFSLRWMKAKLTIACIQCPSKKSVCTISSNTSSSQDPPYIHLLMSLIILRRFQKLYNNLLI